MAKAIIHESILIGSEQFDELDDKQRGKELRAMWLRDSDQCRGLDALETAMSILREGLKHYPKKKKLWNGLIDL